MFFVYILFSVSENKYYVGQCEDIDKRLQRHNANQVPSTKNKGPWKCVYTETFHTRSEAVIRETEIKKMKSKGYIEKLVNDTIIS